jgi:hypothetical protein
MAHHKSPKCAIRSRKGGRARRSSTITGDICCGEENQLLEHVNWVIEVAPYHLLFTPSAPSPRAFPRPCPPRRVADTRGSCRRSSAEKDCITVTVPVHTSHMSLCTFTRRAPASLSWVSRTRTAGAMPLRAKITNPAWMTGTRKVHHPDLHRIHDSS